MAAKNYTHSHRIKSQQGHIMLGEHAWYGRRLLAQTAQDKVTSGDNRSVLRERHLPKVI